MNPHLMDLLLYVLFSMLIGAAGWMTCISRARATCHVVAIRSCSRALHFSILLLLPLFYVHLLLDASITTTAMGWLLYYGAYYSFIVFTLGSVVYIWVRIKICHSNCQVAEESQHTSHHHA